MLNRHEGERILIGNNIVIEVVKIQYNSITDTYRAKLAITAPRHIEVHREEWKRSIEKSAKS
jgi:carbon storage regulator CsrA